VPPSVAIVIPAFNPGSPLIESVDSALQQTLSDIEVVVIDDGSQLKLPILPPDERLRVIRQDNQGVSAARNHGVAQTSAPLVAFLDADDRWLPDKLERQVAALAEHPEAVACYTSFHHINPRGERLGPGNANGRAGYDDLLSQCPVPMSSAVVSRDAFIDAGRFDVFYSIVADWDLWLRLTRLGPFVFIDEPLIEYRVANHNMGQMSGDPMRAYRESSSLFDRQEIAALRTFDQRTLELVAAGRATMKRMRARQAAVRFVDSLGAHPEWPMLKAALAIEPRAAVAAISLNGIRRSHRTLRRLLPI
jgi:glycosyltransferase involved in cell wall biosynthesis